MCQILQDKNIKCTKQRVLMYNLFKVDQVIKISEIIDTLRLTYPNISMQTVYENIYLFESNYLINSITHKSDRYYYLTPNCAHKSFCVYCHEITNLQFCPKSILEKEINGEIIDHNLFVKIICQKCQKISNQERE